VLFTADIGPATASRLFEAIKDRLSRKQLANADAVWKALREISLEILDLPAPPLDFSRGKPFVFLVAGVNGVGKTTTIGKLASQYKAQGHKVLLAAADTSAPLPSTNWRCGPNVLDARSSRSPKGPIFVGGFRRHPQSQEKIMTSSLPIRLAACIPRWTYGRTGQSAPKPLARPARARRTKLFWFWMPPQPERSGAGRNVYENH
jgi:hypothetical protein